MTFNLKKSLFDLKFLQYMFNINTCTCITTVLYHDYTNAVLRPITTRPFINYYADCIFNRSPVGMGELTVHV